MKIFSEFREFISRGNVIDLAVGVIIGAAFNKIVSALVDEVIMPVIGLLTAGVDFAQLKVVLKQADPVAKHAEVAIKYGDFINAIVQFLIVAMTVFFLVKTVNMLRRLTDRQQQQEAAQAAAETPPAPTPSEALLMEIRDELKNRALAPTAPPASAAKAQPARASSQKRPASRKSK